MVDVGVRIVVADNDPAVLELLQTDLGLEGHTIVASLTDSTAVVATCRTERPDVAVLDYRMTPGPNGLEVAADVLDLDDPPRVILYTNYTDPAVRRAAKRLGVVFLAKGDLRNLRRAITDG